MSLRGRSFFFPKQPPVYHEIAHRIGVRRKCRREDHSPRNGMLPKSSRDIIFSAFVFGVGEDAFGLGKLDHRAGAGTFLI